MKAWRADGALVAACGFAFALAQLVIHPNEQILDALEIGSQVGDHPRLTGALVAAGGLAGLYYWRASAQRAALERAVALQRNIRIVKQRDPRLMAHLLRHLFSSHVRGPSPCLTSMHALQTCSP